MRAFIIATVAALSLAGCTLPEFEADAAKIIAAIRQGAQVVDYEVRQAADTTCGTLLPAANVTAMQVVAAFPNPGPKTAAKLAAMRKALATASAACDSYRAGASGAGLARLAVTMWNAYQGGRTAMQQAQAAGGS